MKKTIIFYNSHQNGDIISVVQGIRWIIDHLDHNYNFLLLLNKKNNPIFVHNKIDFLELPISFHGFPMIELILYCEENNFTAKDAIWVDTWIGSIENATPFILPPNNVWKLLLPDENGLFSSDSREIIWSLEFVHELFVITIKSLNEFLFEENTELYIPEPDLNDLLLKINDNSVFNIEVKNFLIQHNKFYKKILICNGDVQSGQRENFSYEEYFEEQIINNPNVAFYFTDKKNELKYNNVFYINDYFSLPNLNQILYLTQYIDVIFSSQSGPGCLSYNDKYIHDERKILFNICDENFKPYVKDVKCKMVLANNYKSSFMNKLLTLAIDET
jgi:hypothetical protein